MRFVNTVWISKEKSYYISTYIDLIVIFLEKPQSIIYRVKGGWKVYRARPRGAGLWIGGRKGVSEVSTVFADVIN